MTMSVPRRKPPSTMIWARPPAASHHLRQHGDRALAVVELAAAVVGDVDALDAVLDGDAGVLGRGDALENEGDLEFLAQPRDIGPGEACLEIVGLRGPARGRHVALGEVALAPAVVVEVDGEAERDVAVGDGALDVVLDPGRVAADVELEDLGMIVAGRHRLEARRALRAQHVQGAEARRGPRRRRAAARHHVLQRADRRQDHRQPQLLAEHLGARVDLLDVAQHARTEGQRVDGRAVPHIGRLRLGAAHQVVPGAARDVALGRREELVQDRVLQLLLHSPNPRVPMPCRGRAGAKHHSQPTRPAVAVRRNEGG